MLKIFLITISLLLAACAKDEFPADYLYSVDTVKQICDKYKIDKANVKFKFVEQVPFEQCPIVYGFQESDIGNIMNWVRRMKKKADKCQN